MSRNRIILICFGLLDLGEFHRRYPVFLKLLNNIGELGVMQIQLLLILSFLVSGFAALLENRFSLTIYFFQFPLRLSFLMLSCGFILQLLQFQVGTFNYGMVMAFCLGLECVRLVLSIQLWRRAKL